MHLEDGQTVQTGQIQGPAQGLLIDIMVRHPLVKPSVFLSDVFFLTCMVKWWIYLKCTLMPTCLEVVGFLWVFFFLFFFFFFFSPI